MNLALMAAFWGVVLLLVIVPGPDWAYTVTSGLRDRSVLPAVAGIVLGYLVLTAIVAAGVGALVARYPMVLTAVTVVGGSYLIYLGISTLARPSGVRDIRGVRGVRGGSDLRSVSVTGRILRGIGVSGLNPKGLLLFVAILPQFTDSSSPWPFAVQAATLGVLFAVTCAAFYTVLGFSTRSILRTRPSASRLLARISAGAMILVGVVLLVERLE